MPPSRPVAVSSPLTVSLFPMALLASAPAQGWSPSKVGPPLGGKHRAAMWESTASGSKTMPPLSNGSNHVEEHATLTDSLRTVSPVRGLLHQRAIKIRSVKSSTTPAKRKWGDMAYLVERSMNGGAMRLSTHGTTGGDAIGGATDNTAGPKADEAPWSQRCHSCPPHRAPQWPLPPPSLTPPNRAPGM